MTDAGDGLADGTSGKDSGLFDLETIAGSVATVHAASSQIDDYVGSIEFLYPISQIAPVPSEDAPRHTACCGRMARQYGDRVAASMEVPSQKPAQVPCASRDDDT